MTQEAIALAVADLRAGRIAEPHFHEDPWRLLNTMGRIANMQAAKPATTVDITAIYESIIGQKLTVYGDHPCIAPPFPAADFCFVDHGGAAVVLNMESVDLLDADSEDEQQARSDIEWENPTAWPEHEDYTRPATALMANAMANHDMETNALGDEMIGEFAPDKTIDWTRVRWELWVHAYVSVRGRGTRGPAHRWTILVYEDGGPASVRYEHMLPEHDLSHWTTPTITMLSALNFLNCKNVELADPILPRSRSERRRLERTGIDVHTITVRQVGRRSSSSSDGDGAMPLSSVRGHFSHYGDCCPGYHEPRGLLFGRLTGRYWVPQHARGSAEHGEVQADYELAGR